MGASGEQEFPKKRATKCGFYEEVMLVDKTLTGITKIIELRILTAGINEDKKPSMA
jgi:hypothetical protein